MRSTRFLALAAFSVLALSGCVGSDAVQGLTSLKDDGSTITVHQTVTAPWGTVVTDAVRTNSTNTAATANTTGAAVNTPPGATVNPAPVKPVSGTTLPAPTAPNAQ